MIKTISNAVRKTFGLYSKAEMQRLINDAKEQGRSAERDQLATELLKRGGFATIQLNPDPWCAPRMKFVDPDQTQAVDSVLIGQAKIVTKAQILPQ